MIGQSTAAKTTFDDIISGGEAAFAAIIGTLTGMDYRKIQGSC